jgi:hypothetical protein
MSQYESFALTSEYAQRYEKTFQSDDRMRLGSKLTVNFCFTNFILLHFFLVDRINITIGGLKKRTTHTNSPYREEGEELIQRQREVVVD